MAELVIYGSPVSPFVRKALAVCAEKNLDFELGQVNVFDPPDWFREISPMVAYPGAARQHNRYRGAERHDCR